MNDVVFQTLLFSNALFLAVVLTYYLVTHEKRNRLQYDKYIRGTWQRAGKSEIGEAWHINYTFIDKEFIISAIPNYEIRGKYKIVKEIENLLILELFDVKGNDNFQNHQTSIGIDKRSNQIVIEGRVYGRIA